MYAKYMDISIHALREESDLVISVPPGTAHLISIHALREESDRIQMFGCNGPRYFYPRSP